MADRRLFMIQGIYASGDVAYLRHGARGGYGSIVRFRDRKTADLNAEMLMESGEFAAVNVVRYNPDEEDADDSPADHAKAE